LICEEQDGLETEFAVAEIEEVFERGAKEIKNHCVVIAFCAEPPYERNTNTARECLVDL
jgi:hypothetical protein